MEWVMIVVGALIIILLALAIIFRDKDHKTDYHAFFIMGIIWVGAGIPLMVTANSPGLFFLGIVFMAVGLIHHKKWKQNIKDRHKNIKKMSKKEKKRHFILRLAMLIALILGLIVLLVFFFLSG